MGSAMAARLISDAAALTVWNRTASKAAPLIELGATQADTLSDLGGCDIVFTSVTSLPDLLAVMLGPEGLLRAQLSPSIVVDNSTVSAEAAAKARAEAADRGIGFVTAPISGQPDMVAEGQVSIVASGPAPVSTLWSYITHPNIQLMVDHIVDHGGTLLASPHQLVPGRPWTVADTTDPWANMLELNES